MARVVQGMATGHIEHLVLTTPEAHMDMGKLRRTDAEIKLVINPVNMRIRNALT